MTNEISSKSNNPHSTSNDGPAEAPQSDVSADVKLDDLVSGLADCKSAVHPSEPVTDHGQAGKTAGHGGTAAPSVRKKLGNKNALLHGVYSRDFILPWESEGDFETLHKEFRDEWRPNGRSEEEAVLELTNYTWLKRRLVKSAQLRFFKCSLSPEMKPGEGSWAWEDMIEWQKNVSKSGPFAVSRASKFMDELNATFEHIRSHHYWTKDSEGKDIQLKLSLLQRDVSSLIEETRTKVIDGVQHLVAVMNAATTYLDQAYQPDEIEMQVDLMAKLDARIEKVIHRLTSIKIFKRVDGVQAPTPSLLESPSVVPVDNSMEKAPAKVAESTEARENDRANRNPVAHGAPEHRGKPKAG